MRRTCLFQGDTAPTCFDACDTNDDGGIDISDVIFILAYFFQQGNPPGPPFPECGLDPSPDTLDCGNFAPYFCP